MSKQVADVVFITITSPSSQTRLAVLFVPGATALRAEHVTRMYTRLKIPPADVILLQWQARLAALCAREDEDMVAADNLITNPQSCTSLVPLQQRRRGWRRCAHGRTRTRWPAAPRTARQGCRPPPT